MRNTTEAGRASGQQRPLRCVALRDPPPMVGNIPGLPRHADAFRADLR